MKLSIFIISLLLSFFANANDGSMPYLDVQGVNPHEQKHDGIWVDVYGDETVQLFNKLPIDFVYPDESRSLFMKSAKWLAGFSCRKSYQRPTDLTWRDDHICSFTLVQNLLDTEDTGDTYNVHDGSETFGPLEIGALKALGVNPNGNKEGPIFSFYGKQTSYFADTLLANGPLTMESKAWKVSMSCAPTYKHPLTGELKDDGICTVNLTKK